MSSQETSLEKPREAENVAAVRHSRRPPAERVLLAMYALLALVSVPSGISMLADPTGSVIGGSFILPYLTRAIPFIHDFVPIGIWLVMVFGVFPIAIEVGIWLRERWEWYASVFLGTVVVTWIAIEIPMFYSLGFIFYYPLIGGIGIAILGLSLLRSVN